MRSKFIHLMLISLIAAPLNYGAASWMAMDVPESTAQAVEVGMSMTMPHHVAMPSVDASQYGGSDTHHNDTDECDEHCMSCNAHCFGPAAVSSTATGYPHAVSRFQTSTSSDILNRSSLLFRPPIHA